jgi:hypothetical protein
MFKNAHIFDMHQPKTQEREKPKQNYSKAIHTKIYPNENSKNCMQERIILKLHVVILGCNPRIEKAEQEGERFRRAWTM